MGHNADMTNESLPQDFTSDLDALETALQQADPADAPDSADAIADSLNELLDKTAAEPPVEDSP